jgi:hypothetical protein
MNSFPTHAQLWIYAADKPLSAEVQENIQRQLAGFFSQWQSHGRKVTGTSEIWHDRFVAVASYLEGDISGCGIDASVHAVEEVGAKNGVSWLPAMTIFYQDAQGNIQALTRPAFRALVQQGIVTADTTVFDTALNSLAALNQNGFAKPAANSWHAKVFRIPEVVT